MRRRNSGIPSRFILAFLSILCIVFLFVNYSTGFSGGPLQTVANYIFIPMQKGISYIGSSVSVSSEDAKTKEELISENQALQTQVDELTSQLTNMQLQQSELTNLQELYALDQQYADYKTTGAHVIAKGTSNWFDTFTIDKGSDDGIKVDMNVIAGSGLVGIVTEVGPGYSVIKSIINDSSAVSGMILDTSDNCIVSGDLESMTSSNTILLSNLEDTENQVSSGTSVVTSNISNKYLPGILIGYVTSIEADSNGLTKSGTITPVVDFKHLQDVLVILETKETGE
ncbi:MAG: rod shape-determining protein MreC [Lachnospiraceae bacterium]|nr:rod shape-determining protein MreC [Lachnospiraceae bacterium]